jgi:shikimate dehydrogenase
MTAKDDSPEVDLTRACVLGWPVSQSLSPKLHGWWLRKYGIAGAYTAMAIPAVTIYDALKMLADRGFAGCNLTSPLKEVAMPLMHEHDESCLMSGAVNTVVIRNGRLHGYNSDGFGFLESLKAQYPAWKGGRVAVIGAGGAARGVIASLRGAGGGPFALVNRTPEKAVEIVKAFSLDAEVYPWLRRSEALKDATLLVNCSTLGMVGHPPMSLDLQHLPKEAAVCDIVYRPLMTDLLNRAKARGNPVIEGLGMLLHQGRLGFGHWYGRDPVVSRDLYEYMGQLAS